METATLTIELVADDLSFPTSVTFDADGTPYVAESGLPFDNAERGGRVLKVNKDGTTERIATALRHPVNGLCFHNNDLIVSEGGYPGRISRLTTTGKRTTVLDDLPGLGNYHTNMVAVGPDDKFYFSQGALTNLGVIGMDAYELGWLGRLPHNCDVPAYDLVLTGQNFETVNPLAQDGEKLAYTGPFSPFATPSVPDQKIKAGFPSTSSVMRCNPDGSELELVCWGIRNAYGLGFLPDGRLIATDQGSDDRGSRPIANVPELLFEVKEGLWYGFPDYIGGIPVTDEQFKPQRGPAPKFILKNHDELPPLAKPLAALPINSAATKFDVVPASAPCFQGQLLVALFGDEKPMTAPPGARVGRNIGRVDPTDWSFHRLFIPNLLRPIDVRFNPVDGQLYILDFGYFEMTGVGVDAKAGSGKLWKVNPESFCN